MNEVGFKFANTILILVGLFGFILLLSLVQTGFSIIDQFEKDKSTFKENEYNDYINYSEYNPNTNDSIMIYWYNLGWNNGKNYVKLSYNRSIDENEFK